MAVLERASKLVVFVGALAALTIEVVMIARGWGALLTICAVLFAVSMVAAFLSRRTIAIVLAFTYVFPAAILAVHGDYFIYFGVLWMSALAGAIAPDAFRTSWNVAPRWRAPLAGWGLTVVAGAAITAWREVDFYPAIVDWPGYVWSSSGGVAPGAVVSWVLYVAVVALLGILWFDWLCGAADLNFHTWVAAPLVLSALIMAGVSLYQSFGDVLFLNRSVFGAIARAPGTVVDANVCGAVSALWLGGVVLWTVRLPNYRVFATVSGLILMWFTVWASGSRSAFAGAAIVTLALLVSAGLAARRWRWHSIAGGAAIIAAVAVLLALLLASSRVGVVGPLGRARAGGLPGPSAASMRAFITTIWNRDNYGVAATAMIREFPWFGVGVGSFQILLPDFAKLLGFPGLAPDNAQNWYRQQLVELGVIGSLAWIAWVVLFVTFVVRRLTVDEPTRWTAAGILFSFAAISFVGVPGQDVIVAITFWTFVFWFVALADAPARSPREPNRSADVPASSPPRDRVLTWAVVFGVVLVYAIGSGMLAAGRLRVPLRAEAAGWPYSYGFYDPEPDGRGGEQRWTARRAVALVDAPAPWLILTVGVNHSDLAERPVDARVWCDGELVIKAHLTTIAPATKYIHVADGKKQILLETSVSRVVTPSDFGVADNRSLGLLVSWKFVEKGPQPE